jgi:heme A synthase
VFSALMLVAAVAMWQLRYWAVIGFQALLGITIVTAGLSMLLAANVQGAVIALVILVPASALFWSLIRPMARLRMPERPGR